MQSPLGIWEWDRTPVLRLFLVRVHDYHQRRTSSSSSADPAQTLTAPSSLSPTDTIHRLDKPAHARSYRATPLLRPDQRPDQRQSYHPPRQWVPRRRLRVARRVSRWMQDHRWKGWVSRRWPFCFCVRSEVREYDWSDGILLDKLVTSRRDSKTENGRCILPCFKR